MARQAPERHGRPGRAATRPARPIGRRGPRRWLILGGGLVLAAILAATIFLMQAMAARAGRRPPVAPGARAYSRWPSTRPHARRSMPAPTMVCIRAPMVEPPGASCPTPAVAWSRWPSAQPSRMSCWPSRSKTARGSSTAARMAARPGGSAGEGGERGHNLRPRSRSASPWRGERDRSTWGDSNQRKSRTGTLS